MKKNIFSTFLVLISMLINILVPSSLLITSAASTTLVSLDDQLTVNFSTKGISEVGGVQFMNWNKSTIPTTMTAINPVGSFYKAIEWKQSGKSLYEDHIQINNPLSYDIATDPVAIEIKYRVKLADYTVGNLPTADLRLKIDNIIGQDDFGFTPSVPNQADENTLRTVKYVIDPTTKKVYCSSNGSTYLSKAFTVPATTVLNNVRMYTRAATPNSGDAGGTALSTPLTWTFESIKVWQAPHDEILPAASIPNLLLNLDDSIVSTNGGFNYSQVGAIAVIKIADTSIIPSTTSTFSIKQTKMASWKDQFTITNPTGFVTDKKTIVEIRYKVKLDDYTVATKPTVQLRLTNAPPTPDVANLSMNAMSAYVPLAAEADTWKTVKITVDPTAKKIYSSYNGAAETSVNFASNTLPADGIMKNIRLYPVSVPGTASPVDGTTVLESPVTWTFDYYKVYNEDYVVVPTASPTATPTPYIDPDPTPTPMQKNLDALIGRTYPNGLMKAVVLSNDDSAVWSWVGGQEPTMLEILNRHGVKATFNVMCGPDYLYDSDPIKFKTNLATNYAGHELASHTMTHPQPVDLYADLAKTQSEFANSKAVLDNLLGYPIGGLATAYGYEIPDNTVYDMIRGMGYKYVRNANTTGRFDIPTNFYYLSGTFWFGGTADRATTEEQLKTDFKNLDPAGKIKLFMINSHSGDFKNNNRWDSLESLCTYITDNSATMWNPTTIEYINYLYAQNHLKCSFSATNDIVINNPSTTIDVWTKIGTKEYKIAAGQTITVDNPTVETFIPKNYLINVDDSITLDPLVNGTRLANETGTIAFRWGNATITGIGADAQTPTLFKQLQVRQTKMASSLDHISLYDKAASAPVSFSIDKPLVIESKFKIKLDNYTGNLPKVGLGLQYSTAGFYSNSGIGTEITAPIASDGETYHTVKIILDNATKKAYWNVDGGTFSSKAFVGTFNSSTFNDIRLYTVALPFATGGTDGTTLLETPVTWTFDYVKVYQVESNEALKLSNMSVKRDTVNTHLVNYSVNVVNNGTTPVGFTCITALYATVNGVNKIIDARVYNANSIGNLGVLNPNGSFDISQISGNYAIKTFLWDGVSTIIPYDARTVTDAQVK